MSNIDEKKDGEKMSKELPILFSTEMVKAILSGKKTQTRRVIKVQPSRPDFISLQQIIDTTRSKKIIGKYYWGNGEVIGNKSDSKYFNLPYGEVGDRLWVRETWAPDYNSITDASALYRADDPPHHEGPWKPSIYMPRWASRITLEIKGKKVERLNDITVEDALAEGMYHHSMNDPRVEFQHLWNSINEKRGYGWDTNPMVLVVEFKRIKP